MLGEFYKMKFLMFFLIICSCSLSGKHETQSTKKDFWWILENYNSSWNSAQVVSLLGKPNRISNINGEDNWIYNRSKTEYQSWAIGISKDNRVTGLAYLPKNQLYIMDIEDRWKSKSVSTKKKLS